jgi:HD-GYP domain-containing protein (c-di-GMP phosphodiesterase class II)
MTIDNNRTENKQNIAAELLRTKSADVTQAHDRLLYAMLSFVGESDCEMLLDKIVDYAMNIASADGAILYTCEDNVLNFARIRSEAHGFPFAQQSDAKSIPGLPLYDQDTTLGYHHNAAIHVALTGDVINIDNIYTQSGYDFSGTIQMDERNDYKTSSMLFVPLKDYHGDVIAVLVLFNAIDPETEEVGPFPAYIAKVVEALALQGGVIYDNHRLIGAQKDLFESFVKSIANAIDAKSPHTSGHCKRVPVLHEMIAEAACDSKTGVFADFAMNDDEKYELRLAAWLHDCGKIAIPEHIMDKATKLEGLKNGISEIATRIEVVKRDLEISCLKKTLMMPERGKEYRREFADKVRSMDENREYLTELNYPDARASDETVQRVRAIGGIKWTGWDGRQNNLLGETEIENLSIRQGTLNESERGIINSHINVTIDMLEHLKLPRGLKDIPEIAGAHHEHVDGSGYPRGLTGIEMSNKAKMLAVADIFEALTASDRPYKHPKTLNQSMAIMANMRDDNHIDSEIFDLFLESKVWLSYATKYMDPMQIDTVDINRYRRSEFALSIEDGISLAAE